MWLLVFVDGILLAENDLEVWLDFKGYLKKCFHIKDLGVLNYFLRIEVVRLQQEIFLCQRKYALDIISACDLLRCKHADSSMEQGRKLALAEREEKKYA